MRLSHLAVIIFSMLGQGCAEIGYHDTIERMRMGPTLSKPYQGAYYVVRPGDTLTEIANAAGKQLSILAYLNDIQSTDKIYPGQIIRMWSKRPYIAHFRDKKILPNFLARHQLTPKKIQNSKTQQSSSDDISSPTLSKTQPTQQEIKSTVMWVWPTQAVVSGRFAPEDHVKGITFSGAPGSDIHAAATGKVAYAGNALRGYGNLLLLSHVGGYLTAYAHNQKILVAEGDTVNAGQKIATLGKTGTSSPQLYFEIRYKGKPVNPEQILPSR